MGGRDHSIECEKCGVQRGGIDELLCHCDYPPLSDEQIVLHQQVVRGLNLCGEVSPDKHTLCILERGHVPSSEREGWKCDEVADIITVEDVERAAGEAIERHASQRERRKISNSELTFSDDEIDSLKKILRHVYLSDWGSRIVDDARRVLKRLEAL